MYCETRALLQLEIRVGSQRFSAEALTTNYGVILKLSVDAALACLSHQLIERLLHVQTHPLIADLDVSAIASSF